jgi:acyl-CoA synthetase (AMP-forming)/AMP-acid ligase II
VKAVIVPDSAQNTSDEELIAFCRERLAHFKCPTSVDRVEALPRNPSGKILKTELREPYWRGHGRRVH